MLSAIDLHSGKTVALDRPAVLCLGNFDGVHKGHAKLLSETKRLSRELSDEYPDIIGGAWCFLQPPADFLFDCPPPHLTENDEKMRLFAKAGLDVVIFGDFNEYKNMSPETFVSEVLIKQCRAVKTVCGFNFRFGKNASGKPSDLTGFECGDALVVPEVTEGGKIVSSTNIRAAILSGDIEMANRMLGRPFSLELDVKRGKHIGSKLGFPTINQNFGKNSPILSPGVYATKIEIDGETFPSITNVGQNPTFGDGSPIHCETHIIGVDKEFHPEKARVYFFTKLRGEKKFPSPEELQNAVFSDIKTVKKYFNI